jgi:hypothetical protein
MSPGGHLDRARKQRLLALTPGRDEDEVIRLEALSSDEKGRSMM